MESWMKNESVERSRKIFELLGRICESCRLKEVCRRMGGVRMRGWYVECERVIIDGYGVRIVKVRLRSGWSRWRNWKWFEERVKDGLF